MRTHHKHYHSSQQYLCSFCLSIAFGYICGYVFGYCTHICSWIVSTLSRRKLWGFHSARPYFGCCYMLSVWYDFLFGWWYIRFYTQIPTIIHFYPHYSTDLYDVDQLYPREPKLFALKKYGEVGQVSAYDFSCELRICGLTNPVEKVIKRRLR